jgi:hypothetical protein
MTPASPSPPAPRPFPLLWVLLAAAGTFALTMGVRQSMGLFLGNAQHRHRPGLASISLAFAFGQLWWGLTQPLRRHRGRPHRCRARAGAGVCWWHWAPR